MTVVLLSVHVLAAIIAVGPIAVAASLFPRFAAPGSDPGPARVLHRICRVYTVVGVVVPVSGLALGAQLGALGDVWLLASIALTVGAALVLGFVVLPDQRRLLSDTATAPARLVRRLAVATGTFNLLWAVVVVLMIARPGSTTGV